MAVLASLLTLKSRADPVIIESKGYSCSDKPVDSAILKSVRFPFAAKDM